MPRPEVIRPRPDVLVAAHSGSLHYGGERSLLELLLYLKAQSVDVHVVVGSSGSFTDRLAREGIPFTLVWMPWWVRLPGDPRPFTLSRSNPTKNTIVRLVQLIRELNPRLCVTNTITIPWLAYAASICRARHVWFIHEWGVKDFDMEYAIGVHELRRSISSFSDGVFFNSQVTAREYAEHVPPAQNLGVIYPVGGPAQLPAPVRDPFNEDSFRVVMVGRIQAGKRQLEAVRAIYQIRKLRPNVELALVGGDGDPAYCRNIREYVRSRGLEGAVHFLGFQSNPFSYLALADMSLICSQGEAFGRTTVEAMLMGLPIVGANSGGTAEIIQHGRTGLLYEPGDESGLVELTLRLLDDPELRAEIGNRAQKVASERYTASKVYEPFMDYLSQVEQQPRIALDLSPLAGLVDDLQVLTDVRLFTARTTGLAARRVSRKLSLAAESSRRLLGGCGRRAQGRGEQL